MENIFFVGLPGSGKTTIGRICAKKLNKTFVDLDKLIIIRENSTINELFEHGEEYFRRCENEALEYVILNYNNSIIATGGGIVECNKNLELLKHEYVIYIKRQLPNIFSTLNTQNRPLLKNNTDRLYEMAKKRHNKYLSIASEKIYNNGTIGYCVKKVLKLLIKQKKV